MNKKLLRGLSVSAIALSLFACGGQSSSSSSSASSVSSSDNSSVVEEKTIKIDNSKAATKDAGTKIVETKQELKERYGMGSDTVQEWNVQTAAFQTYTLGKTIDEVVSKNYQSHYNPEGTEVVAGCSISAGNFVGSLKTITDTKTFTTSTAPIAGAGTIVAGINDENVLTVTVAGVATSAGTDTVLEASINDYQIPLAIDGEKVVLDATAKQANEDNLKTHGAGVSQSLSKRELKELYGMTVAGTEEWFVHADNFAKYAIGKSASELEGKNYKTHYNTEGTEVVTGCTISCDAFAKAIAEGGNVLKTTDAPTAADATEYSLKFGSYVEVTKDLQLEVSVGSVVLNSESKIVSAYFDVLQVPFVIE